MSSWRKPLSLSSSAEASSPLISASWGSCCSLSHRCWPLHAQWKLSAPRGHCGSGARPPPPPPLSLFSASQSLLVSMPRPAVSHTCTAPSPHHPVVSSEAEASQADSARHGGGRRSQSPMMLSNSAGHCHSPWTQRLFHREISYLILWCVVFVFLFFLILCFKSTKAVKATNPDTVQALWGREKIAYWVSSSAWSWSLSIPIVLSCGFFFFKKDTPPLLPVLLPLAHLGWKGSAALLSCSSLPLFPLAQTDTGVWVWWLLLTLSQLPWVTGELQAGPQANSSTGGTGLPAVSLTPASTWRGNAGPSGPA